MEITFIFEMNSKKILRKCQQKLHNFSNNSALWIECEVDSQNKNDKCAYGEAA